MRNVRLCLHAACITMCNRSFSVSVWSRSPVKSMMLSESASTIQLHVAVTISICETHYNSSSLPTCVHCAMCMEAKMSYVLPSFRSSTSISSTEYNN